MCIRDSASTLRYYEEMGLIESIGRRGLKRVFLPSVLEKLSLIELGQAAGFKSVSYTHLDVYKRQILKQFEKLIALACENPYAGSNCLMYKLYNAPIDEAPIISPRLRERFNRPETIPFCFSSLFCKIEVLFADWNV